MSRFNKLHPQRSLYTRNRHKSKLITMVTSPYIHKTLGETTLILGFFLYKTLPVFWQLSETKKEIFSVIFRRVARYNTRIVYVRRTCIKIDNLHTRTPLQPALHDLNTLSWDHLYTKISPVEQLIANGFLQTNLLLTKGEFTKPKITTSVSIRFRKNYSISFLLKPTSTRIYQTIWSCRISCFYRLVAPLYSKVHIKKYKKFLDILATKIFIGFKNHKPLTNIAVVTPDVLDIIPSKVFNIHNTSKSQVETHNIGSFSGSGYVKLHRDFFRSLKIRRSLPRRIRRKVLSKKVGRLWLD